MLTGHHPSSGGSGPDDVPPVRIEDTMTTARSGNRTTARRSLVQTAALLVGAVFLLVGLLGFVPGITTGSGSIALYGHESKAMLLGIFQVSVLHNVVHLLYGVAGLAMARSAPAARSYLLWGGVVYIVLWLYGLLIDKTSEANFVPLNAADDWLHLVLGAGMVGLSFLGRGTHDRGGASRF
jgi:hypothetical protein